MISVFLSTWEFSVTLASNHKSNFEGSVFKVAPLTLGFIDSQKSEGALSGLWFLNLRNLRKNHDLNLRTELTGEGQSVDQASLQVDLCVLGSYQGMACSFSTQDNLTVHRRAGQCWCVMERLRTLGSDSPDSGLRSGFSTYQLLKPQVGLRIE